MEPPYGSSQRAWTLASDFYRNGANSSAAKEEQRMEAYCLKCRTKREMDNAQQVTMKNGKPATKGVCPKCGTSMYRIGKST